MLGQPIVASAPGKVVYSGSGLRGYGKLIILKHNSTYLSVYAHNSQLLVKPEVFIGAAAGKFDAAGQCTDATTRKFVGDQMVAFEKWIAAVKRMSGAA